MTGQNGGSQDRFLIVKTGSLDDVCVDITKRFGDSEHIFSHAAGIGLCDTSVVEVFKGECLPDGVCGFAGAFVTGSEAMVSHRSVWVERTADWLRTALGKGLPLFGVCFGHQLLAYALGAQVEPNPAGLEIGTIDVSFVGHEDDALFGTLPDKAKFHAIHHETVAALPDGVRPLASSALDNCQAIRLGPYAWGVQFHPEYTAEMMRAIWSASGPEIESGKSIDELLDDTPHGPALMRRFVALARSRCTSD
ncbi:MAG: glutamine amidotransferase [Roseitalea sp.]|jgi:GMP synthase (glutamine-hydrolysing)|uniref:Glutamine amidotransferase n=1 Tax=Oceaniradius stylonematis TaxID=2184161 RepID=A0A3A8AC85_9HYPH|nr:glutamine amidotransferase [Oceaniradius stylonematis]MBO6554289.1 glutamine amidotransferase [Roseitalea sp.]MBO6953333.1 glutamine amidotransferase [Rhizobiaceae bacterium]MBO6593680.1 glutamine amidotransferase [Roseitalea sp.]MBO6601076.1 glutamine amidotransferase [Roseitalea sp.]MBO6612757.1 glutamine amidotransferase [Roseitalea sp.]